jgi:hypothetical protein
LQHPVIFTDRAVCAGMEQARSEAGDKTFNYALLNELLQSGTATRRLETHFGTTKNEWRASQAPDRGRSNVIVVPFPGPLTAPI